MQGFADSTDESSRLRDASARALAPDEEGGEGMEEEGIDDEDTGHGLLCVCVCVCVCVYVCVFVCVEVRVYIHT
jgi:hypothetical protein